MNTHHFREAETNLVIAAASTPENGARRDAAQLTPGTIRG